MLNQTILVEQLIPSVTMKRYLLDNNIHFSEREWATIIWNSGLKLIKIHEHLTEIAKHTKDIGLKKEIEERIEYDKGALNRFYEDSEGFVYVLESLKSEKNGDSFIFGYFKNTETAYRYGLESESAFQILKHQLIDENSVRKKIRYVVSPMMEKNPEKQIQEVEMPGMEIAAVIYNADGSVRTYWSDEMPEKDMRRVDNLSNERFENGVVNMPNPFTQGDHVREVDSEKIGIVTTSQSEWKHRIEQALKPNSILDWSDLQICVQFDEEGNNRMERHIIHPFYLEKR